MTKIALQAEKEGSLDITLRESKPHRDKNGNMKVDRADHGVLLNIPGNRHNKRLIITRDNAKGLGVGSLKEFWRFLQTHPGPAVGDFSYSLVLDDFKYQELETMTYDELLAEIEARTGIPPTRKAITKKLGIIALRRLRELAEQNKATPVVVAPDPVPTPVAEVTSGSPN